MKEYILGHPNTSDSLKEYKTKKEASLNSEEWCVVRANSLAEAKRKYEATFIAVKANNFNSIKS